MITDKSRIIFDQLVDYFLSDAEYDFDFYDPENWSIHMSGVVNTPEGIEKLKKKITGFTSKYQVLVPEVYSGYCNVIIADIEL